MNATTATIDAPRAELMPISIRDAFGLPEISENAKVMGLKPGLGHVPLIDPDYVFEVDRLRQICMHWAGGFTALMLEGDPSAGKTSFVKQFHNRLNAPLYMVPCTPNTEERHLIGQLLPASDGSLRWQDGPVTRACREGTSVLLDEYNVLDPGAQTGLNMLLEGNAWMIPETGEVITPAPTTRFFATQNAIDGKVAVTGRNLSDAANEDRWCYMLLDFVAPELEKALVRRKLMAAGIAEEIAKTVATVCVDVATKVREAFRAGEPAIEKPLSTRVVLRWAKLTVMYQAGMAAQRRSGLHFAVNQAVRLSPTMAQSVQQFITLVAGYDAELP